jgi:hypothetical protein
MHNSFCTLCEEYSNHVLDSETQVLECNTCGNAQFPYWRR